MTDFFAWIALLILGGSILAAALVLIFSVIAPLFVKTNYRGTPSGSASQSVTDREAQARASSAYFKDDADEDELHH